MDKEKNLKKKLFIGGAYLVVALLLLIYVSYSAYRIRYVATVQMPEALEQKASLNITYYSQAEGKAKDKEGPGGSEIVLKGLRPNEDVNHYASAAGQSDAQANGRMIKFTVSNADLIEANEGRMSEEFSKLKTQYTITLTETGVVPLDCILVKKPGVGEEAEISTLSTDNEYQRRGGVFQKQVVIPSGIEGQDDTIEYVPAVFYLSNDKLEEHEFTLYIGWNNDRKVFDGSERKEIATIELQANITQSVPIATSSVAAPTVTGFYTEEKPTEAQE